MTLIDLTPSQIGVIDELGGEAHYKSRLMEMGICKHVEIRLIQKMPFNGPLTFKVRSGIVSLRASDAGRIKVTLNGK